MTSKHIFKFVYNIDMTDYTDMGNHKSSNVIRPTVLIAIISFVIIPS